MCIYIDSRGRSCEFIDTHRRNALLSCSAKTRQKVASSPLTLQYERQILYLLPCERPCDQQGSPNHLYGEELPLFHTASLRVDYNNS